MQCHFAAPIRRSHQGFRRAGYSCIGHAKPNDFGLNLCPHRRHCGRRDLAGQPSGSPQTLSRLAYDDLVDPVSRSVQRYGQRAGQIPGTDNGYTRLG
jgi:hypothetical protein